MAATALEGHGRTVFETRGTRSRSTSRTSRPRLVRGRAVHVMQGVTPILAVRSARRAHAHGLPERTFETSGVRSRGVRRTPTGTTTARKRWSRPRGAPPATSERTPRTPPRSTHTHRPCGRWIRLGDVPGHRGQRPGWHVHDAHGARHPGQRPLRDRRPRERRARADVQISRRTCSARTAWMPARSGSPRRRGERHLLVGRSRLRDARGARPLRRPLCVYVTPPKSGELLAERLVYGEAVPAAAPRRTRAVAGCSTTTARASWPSRMISKERHGESAAARRDLPGDAQLEAARHLTDAAASPVERRRFLRRSPSRRPHARTTR